MQQKGLITHIGYDDEAREAAEQKAGGDPTLTGFDRYSQATQGQGAPSSAPTIALVHAAGEILEGDNNSPLSDNVDSIYGDVFGRPFGMQPTTTPCAPFFSGLICREDRPSLRTKSCRPSRRPRPPESRWW